VAATFEKANTYVFAAPIIRDREVGGSNPLAPTNQLQHKQLRLPRLVSRFCQVAILWTKFFSFEELSCISEVTIYEKPPKKREKLRAILTHGPIFHRGTPNRALRHL